MNKFKIALTLLFVFSISSLTIAQNAIDYDKIRPETCKSVDSSTIDAMIENLLKIDTSKISNGLCDYYYDLGMMYYEKSYMLGQPEFRDLCIRSFNKCLAINKKGSDAYYNLCLIYYFDKHYNKAKEYVKLYKKYTKKKYWDKTFIDMVEKS